MWRLWLGLIASVAVASGQEEIPKPRAITPARVPDSTLYRPTPMPDRVHLTWSDKPATTQSITWRTDTTVQTAQVQFSPAEAGPYFVGRNASKSVDPNKEPDRKALPDRRSTIMATSTKLVTDLSEALYHSVTLRGLSPNTAYVYRVGDGVNWTEWHQFKTPSDKTAPLRFIYFGDAQNDIKEHWSRVARGAYADMPKAHFILHAGDLVNTGTSDGQWGEWHGAPGWINGAVPSVPLPGNHEYSGRKGLTPHWRATFTLPENGPPGLEESAYTIDIQGVRIIALNSNEKIPEQAAWLDKVLAENPNRWTVVSFHHPIYSTAKGRDNKSLREAWRPILDKHGVDLVLTGHDHSYGRSGLMREDNLVSGLNLRGKGTIYCVSVSGPKQYVLGQGEWMRAKGQDVQLYQLITVDGDRLHYKAHTADGQLFDEFTLDKRPDGSNALSEPMIKAQAEGNSIIVTAIAALATVIFIVVCSRKLR
jgi:Purple acid Phosphatase, N-terminal domain/Calcineurin-like phosphoesterase